MINDVRPSGLQMKACEPEKLSAWQRLWIRLRDIEQAMNMSYDEMQERRIVALERELAQVKSIIDHASHGDYVTPDDPAASGSDMS